MYANERFKNRAIGKKMRAKGVTQVVECHKAKKLLFIKRNGL
jgi:hypothetical protein